MLRVRKGKGKGKEDGRQEEYIIVRVRVELANWKNLEEKQLNGCRLRLIQEGNKFVL